MSGDLSDLFRSEVVEARRSRLDGEVVLYKSIRISAIVLLLSVIMAAVTTWAMLGKYSRIESVRGVLASTVPAAKILAISPGIVIRLPVKDGQIVRRGDVLATIRIDMEHERGHRPTQEQLAAVELQQDLAAQQAAASKLRSHNEQIGLASAIRSSRAQAQEVESQIQLQSDMVQSLEDTLTRYRSVAERGFVSKTELAQRQQEVLSGRQALARLRQQLAVLKQDEARSRADMEKSKADEEIEAAEGLSSVAGLRVQHSRLQAEQSYVLTAPIDGEVTALQVGIGQVADTSLPLMTVVPHNLSLHADLYAPSKAVGFIRPGQEVRLLYDAFPYDRFGSFAGKVQSVSRVALDPRQVGTINDNEEPVYRVKVIPLDKYGPDKGVRLQPGMTLSANLVLEKRSFFEWLLQPLNAVLRRDR